METTTTCDGRTFNAYRHGLTGQVQIRTQADQAAYDVFCTGIHQSLAPAGALEASLAQSVADDRWRLHRAAALENNILALLMSVPDAVSTGTPDTDDAMAQAQAWLHRGKDLHLLAVYEHRLTRHVEKNMAELRRLQAERQAALSKALEEAEFLAQLAESEGEAFDPAEDAARNAPPNFVFSASEFARLYARNRRLARLKKPTSPPQKLPRMAA